MTTGLGQIERPSPKQQIIRILVLLASAICLGCLIVFAMIVSWGPDGSYGASDILLAPETLSKLAFDDTDRPQIFDGVEYQGQPVALDTYQRFFSLIEKDRSLPIVDEATTHRFDASDGQQITIWVRAKTSSSSSRQVFQQVDVSPRDHLYRIEKYGASPPQWLYFEHPGISEQTRQIFAGSR